MPIIVHQKNKEKNFWLSTLFSIINYTIQILDEFYEKHF